MNENKCRLKIHKQQWQQSKKSEIDGTRAENNNEVLDEAID